MSSMDLYEDDFPHGTKQGYERGCKGGACPNSFAVEEGAVICRDAFARYNGDFAYRKAVDAGETPPPLIVDAATSKAYPHAEERVWAEPEITVADTVEEFVPEPVLEDAPAEVDPMEVLPEPKAKKTRTPAVHPSNAMYQRGCRRDEECPAFLEGGVSCRMKAREYQRDRKQALRGELANVRSGASRRPRLSKAEPAVTVSGTMGRTVSDLLSGVDALPDTECTVTPLASGGLVVIIRIPAKVVAA